MGGTGLSQENRSWTKTFIKRRPQELFITTSGSILLRRGSECSGSKDRIVTGRPLQIGAEQRVVGRKGKPCPEKNRWGPGYQDLILRGTQKVERTLSPRTAGNGSSTFKEQTTRADQSKTIEILPSLGQGPKVPETQNGGF